MIIFYKHYLNAMDGCKILIIDDDEDDVEILSEAFTRCGVDEIQYVFSAMQAFMYLQEVEHDFLPKLIITDHFLPGISGAEFLKDLKGMDKYKHIHVMVLSTIKTERIRRGCVRIAVCYYKKRSSVTQQFRLYETNFITSIFISGKS